MISDTIRKLRMERSFTQEYVALELGISQNAYCKIENGQVQLTIDRLQKIAAILDTPLALLFNYQTEQESRDSALPFCQDVIVLLQGELQAKQKVVDDLLGIIKVMQGSPG